MDVAVKGSTSFVRGPKSVRWLSRGKCLSRLYELQVEVEIFLWDNENNLHVHLHNEESVMMLEFLTDQRNEPFFARPWCDSQWRLRQACRTICSNGSLAGANQGRVHFIVSFLGRVPGDRKDWVAHRHQNLHWASEIISTEFRSYFDDAPLPVSWHEIRSTPKSTILKKQQRSWQSFIEGQGATGTEGLGRLRSIDLVFVTSFVFIKLAVYLIMSRISEWFFVHFSNGLRPEQFV